MFQRYCQLYRTKRGGVAMITNKVTEDTRENQHELDVRRTKEIIKILKGKGVKKIVFPANMVKEMNKRYVNDIRNDEEYEIKKINGGVIILFKE
jgi:hypothetical protein